MRIRPYIWAESSKWVRIGQSLSCAVLEAAVLEGHLWDNPKSVPEGFRRRNLQVQKVTGLRGGQGMRKVVKEQPLEAQQAANPWMLFP